MAAVAVNAEAAAEQTGVPRRTIRYWLDAPEFADLRQKTQRDQAEGARVLALEVAGEIRRRLPEFEPKDLAVLYGILVDKAQLMSGEATTRTETRDLTGDLDDHERKALRDLLTDVVSGPTELTDDDVKRRLAGADAD